MNDRAKAILDFWFDDMVVEKRFKRDDNFDQLIRDKFKDCLLYTSELPTTLTV